MEDDTAEPPEARFEKARARGFRPIVPHMMLAGQPLFHNLTERARIELAQAMIIARARADEPGYDPDAHLRNMDRAGVDMAFLYPTFASYLVAIDSMNPARAGAFARAYNAWLWDFCGRDRERLRGVGLVSLHDPADLVPQLAQIVARGWKAVVLRPNPVKGRTLADPAYEDFWTECERASIAVAIHEGTHAAVPTAGADRFKSRFALHACSHPMEQMMAFLALLEGGVLERHPALRVAFLEAGCGWLPYWLWRLDEIEYRSLAGEVGDNVRMKPSAYFRRQCYIGFEPGEPCLSEVIRVVGEERILFGTDFPHVDHDPGIVDEAWRQRNSLPAGAFEKALRENAARFYGLI
jgi:predicted TIM-barrel fold metal-dependent hydrolase